MLEKELDDLDTKWEMLLEKIRKRIQIEKGKKKLEDIIKQQEEELPLYSESYRKSFSNQIWVGLCTPLHMYVCTLVFVGHCLATKVFL